MIQFNKIGGINFGATILYEPFLPFTFVILKIDILLSFLQIPKGFPYFSVNFGLDGGFAHAIEDEKKFSFYFGKV